MKKLMKNYFLLAGLLIASVLNFVSCAGNVPTDKTIRLELNSSNYEDFNNEEIMSQYIGKEIYIHADETVDIEVLDNVFWKGAYDSIGVSVDEEWIPIYAIVDLSDTSLDMCSFVGNVKKVILSKKCWFIDSFNAGLLEEIIAPDDNNEVTSIDGILYNKNLTTVNGFPRATKIEKLVFPSTLQRFNCEFEQQTSSATKEVVFPSSFKEFRLSSFFRFPALEKVVFEGPVPPAMYSTYTCFTECSPDIKFYVPKGCKQAYVDAWADWYSHAGYAGDLADRIVESD
ncbi:MAG: hypothetical protein MJ160_03865 [Treponema sp.]|nr:hypothetical protein [Treponema sp.]